MVELGYGTTGLSVGQRVFGLAEWARNGSLAEYTAVETRNLAPLPIDVDHTVAAARIAGEPLMSATSDGLAWIYGEKDHNVSGIADARATQPQTAERHAAKIEVSENERK